MGNTLSRWRNYVETGYRVLQQGIENTAETYKPGKPTTDGKSGIDSVRLSWKPPETLYPNHSFQIRYKECPKAQWQYYEIQPKENTVVLSNLQANTKYTVQVRMINTDIEGPYSEPCDEVQTLESAAKRYLEMTYAIRATDESPSLRRIPLEDISQPSDLANKIRKFELGNPRTATDLERTIILVGSKGVGKKTFIDGLVNYCMAVHWRDPCRFSITNRDTNKDTEDNWTNCYCIHPLSGSRLDYRLNIIDTPSFVIDDEQSCKDILQQLQSLFTAQCGKVEFVDAVCFLVRSPDTKLSKAQINTFRSVITSMETDMEENICVVTTFADCKEPPVIQGFVQADIVHGNTFAFNNAGLFVPSQGIAMHPLSPLFWKIGQECCKSFFEQMAKLQRKAPMPVLPERHEVEVKIEDLQPFFVAGLNEIVMLKDEIKVIDDNKKEIETEKAFTYNVTERRQIRKDLPSGQHVTNCLNCYITCHLNCGIPRNEDKHGCSAMDDTGYCTKCFEKCHWSSHANTPFTYEYVEEVITKSYVEKEDIYRKTPDEVMTVGKVLERMNDHQKDLERRVQGKMDEIRAHINLLRRISNRPDTMTLHDQIGLLVQGEEKRQEADYKKRIAVLIDLKQM